ncbi:MAG: SPOR domain-containing protein [Candidatus Omnitrophota bacterium]
MAAKFLDDKKEIDLFEHAQASEKKMRKKVKLLLPQLKNSIALSYENIIFLIVSFIMGSIIFFSLGVEKGRQDTLVAKRGETIVYPEAAETIAIQPDNRETISIAKKYEEAPEEKDGYILRLASFSQEASAYDEKERLVKEGYKAHVRKSGKYYQVYLGVFKTKESAEKLYNNLTRTYKDCYITRL